MGSNVDLFGNEIIEPTPVASARAAQPAGAARNQGQSGKKSRSAYRTISEAAQELDVATHVLRFWESKFQPLQPMKRGGGRRYYSPEDIELLKSIRTLLYEEGYTIRGVQAYLKKHGAKTTKTDMPTEVNEGDGREKLVQELQNIYNLLG